MPRRKAIAIFLVLVYASLAAAEYLLISDGALDLITALPLLSLVVLGLTILFVAKEQRFTATLCFLLASIAVLFSTVYPEDIRRLGPPAGPPLAFVWEALRCLFGFVFLHFALIFPVATPWIRDRQVRIVAIYLPYFLLLFYINYPAPSLGATPGALAETLSNFSMLAGLIIGLAVLVRKYLYTLTTAERNRLRITLIGCMGGFPSAVAVLSREAMGLGLHATAFILFVLFPLALAGAVLKDNFSQIGRWLQRGLIWAQTGAATIAAFFFSYWALALLAGEKSLLPWDPLILPTCVSLAVAYPLLRWSGASIPDNFPAVEEDFCVPGPMGEHFIPIQPNPFIAGTPVRSSEMFFGREEEFQFIRRKLSGNLQGCVIVLCGERRTGKTSILYQILNGRLGVGFFPVFFDMQGVIVRNDGEFLTELASKINAALESHGSSALLPAAAASETYLEFNRFIDRVAQALGHRRLLLLVDEYELIENKVDSGHLSPEIYAYFSSLLLRYPRLSYIITGSRTLEESSAWSELFAQSTYRRISFLAREDARKLICTPLRDRVHFAPGAVSDLLRLTNGHPFFTQIVCQTLVEVLNDSQSGFADNKMVDETVRRILENPPPQLFYQWTTFSSPEKMVLSALATLAKKPYTFISSERVEKLIRSLPDTVPRELDGSVIRMHFEELRAKSFLDRDQTRYRFTMDLMRLWILGEHNVWRVLGEISGKERPSAPSRGWTD